MIGIKMRKLETNLQRTVIADKKTLIAWDYDERLYKKLHFITGAIFKKYGIQHAELKSPWPHISAALISAPLSRDERDKFKMAGRIKPKFVFKKFDILLGKETPFDYFSVEFHNPPEFDKFLKFAQELCGEDRVVKYEENRPHLSLWALKKGDHTDIEKILPEIQQEVKKYLQPFTPIKLSIWEDFEISEIETIGGVGLTIEQTWIGKVRSKYEISAEKYYSKLDVLHFWHEAEGGEDGTYGTFADWMEDVEPERLLPNIDSWVLESIPTDKITEHHTNTQSQIQRAKEFISEGHLEKIPPIIVKRKGDGYETIDGATRLLAYKLSNIPKIKVLRPR